ncbi:MAG: hypothetical protein N2594_01810 [Clostridiales bacterium]|nr:hypothetical protein [Clostridiales bacterium]
MERAIGVNFLTNSTTIDELDTLSNLVFQEINIEKYLHSNFNIFSLKFINDSNDFYKNAKIIENFYNDKYFFFRSEIQNIENEISQIIHEWTNKNVEEYGCKSTIEKINILMNYIVIDKHHKPIKNNIQAEAKYSKYYELNNYYFVLTKEKMINDVNFIILKILNNYKQKLLSA